MKNHNPNDAILEVQLLKKINHPHIIRYLTSFVDEDSLYILMQYAQNGDLHSLLKAHHQKRKHFPQKELWVFGYEIALALECLHKNSIIHRDIKCLNIFIDKNKFLKVGDLGVSKLVEHNNYELQGTRVGTPLYLSPELIKQKPYNYKVDIWALGCVLYHLAALEPPFSGQNIIALGNSIAHKNPKPIPQRYSQQLQDFISFMLEKKLEKRPSITQLLESFPPSVKILYQAKLDALANPRSAMNSLSPPDQLSTPLKRITEKRKSSQSPSTRGAAFFPASASSKAQAIRRGSLIYESRSPEVRTPPVNEEVRKFLEAQKRDTYSAYLKARMEQRDVRSRKASERPVSAKIGSVYQRAHRKSAKHKLEREFSAKLLEDQRSVDRGHFSPLVGVSPLISQRTPTEIKIADHDR